MLDPVWLCNAMMDFISSSWLHSKGAAFLASSLRKILSSLYFPPQSHQLVLKLFNSYEVVYKLRSGRNAYIVPFLLSPQVSAFGDESVFQEFVRSLGSVFSLTRCYNFPKLPRSLKMALLMAMLDVSQVHASIWSEGVVCAMEARTKEKGSCGT